jgi:hypothetical protein
VQVAGRSSQCPATRPVTNASVQARAVVSGRDSRALHAFLHCFAEQAQWPSGASTHAQGP